MHDIRMIRADGAAFDAACARRGLPPAAPAILDKDAARRAAQTALQEKQARRRAPPRARCFDAGACGPDPVMQRLLR